MNKKLFNEILDKIKLFDSQVDEYYKFGVNLFEGTYPIAETSSLITEMFWRSIYSEKGSDCINWFIYENNFGDAGLEMWDNDNLVCQTVDDLYDYIEQYKIC